MGKIIIEAYDKEIYNKTLPDKVCFAIAKEREKKDIEFSNRVRKNE